MATDALPVHHGALVEEFSDVLCPFHVDILSLSLPGPLQTGILCTVDRIVVTAAERWEQAYLWCAVCT